MDGRRKVIKSSQAFLNPASPHYFQLHSDFLFFLAIRNCILSLAPKTAVQNTRIRKNSFIKRAPHFLLILHHSSYQKLFPKRLEIGVGKNLQVTQQKTKIY